MAGVQQDDTEYGEPITAQEMSAALTAGTLIYADGANQTFAADGQRTTYVERGSSTQGTWEILGDGTFSSFWPPDYRATYLVRWIMQRGVRIGISFTDTHSGSRFDGLYR
ncbi:hypothetical protein [Promicromonospora sukumoe]|uniref:hypothetical protein n=1 Tax=Promicromonospora sukumoe TaxID=88382 RepID=UPI000375D161|nr:hypothetical protein [Promicromonospora sukumoe]